jgi:hypothetical protein
MRANGKPIGRVRTVRNVQEVEAASGGFGSGSVPNAADAAATAVGRPDERFATVYQVAQRHG